MRRERKDNIYRGLDSTQHSTNCPRNNSFLCRKKSLGRKTAPRAIFRGRFFDPDSGRATAVEETKFVFDVCTQVRFGRAARRPCPDSKRDRGHTSTGLRPARIGWVRPFTACRTGNTQLRRGARRTEGGMDRNAQGQHLQSIRSQLAGPG